MVAGGDPGTGEWTSSPSRNQRPSPLGIHHHISQRHPPAWPHPSKCCAWFGKPFGAQSIKLRTLADVMAPALGRDVWPFLSGLSARARWAFLFLASLFASPPYGTQRVDFAVLWGAGFTLNPGKWSFPSTAHISRSRCLIPSRGIALLAFAPTIFSSPLPPAGALCLPSRACCKNSLVTADPLTLSLRFAAMGEL